MSDSYILLKEEHTITENKVKEFENTRGIEFPSDYREFILNYNGGVVDPNLPKSTKLKEYIFPIERFFSLQDIELGVIANQRERSEYVIEDINNGKEYYNRGNEEYGFDIEFEKLLFIGVCERGTLHLYCGKSGYGEIWYSNYSGGLGLKNTGLNSFTELLQSLSSENEEWKFNSNNQAYKDFEPIKIFTFDSSIYWSDILKEKSLERFKEVLEYYGDPNKVNPYKKVDVVTHYINNPIILKYLIDSGAKYPERLNRVSNLESLKYLVSKGASVEGLLNSTRNIGVIKYLIEECKQDVNSPFEGKYPLIILTNVDDTFSISDRIEQCELLLDILNLGVEIDFAIMDNQGRSLKDRIELIKYDYDKCILKSPELSKRN